MRRRFWIKLKKVAAKLPFTEDLLAAYYCAFDKQTPRHVQVALLGAIAYFILPFDFIPDMMPVLGFTDDAAILATVIRLVAGPHHRRSSRGGARRVKARYRGELSAPVRMRRKLWPTAERMTLAASPARPLR